MTERCVLCLEDISGIHYRYPFCQCRVYTHFLCFLHIHRVSGCPVCKHQLSLRPLVQAIVASLFLISSTRCAALAVMLPELFLTTRLTLLIAATLAILASLATTVCFGIFPGTLPQMAMPDHWSTLHSSITLDELLQGRTIDSQQYASLLTLFLALALILPVGWLPIVLTCKLLFLLTLVILDGICILTK
jgi:hypothetical protein